MKRSRGLIVLSVVAVLLALLVWWDWRRPSTDEQARQRARLLSGFDRAAVTQVDLQRGPSAIALRRENQLWWLAEPHRRADDGIVEALLSALEYAEIERRIEPTDPALLHKLGLDRPRVTVRVAGHTLRLGGDDPGRGVYVLRDDEPTALVVEHRLIETADVDPRLWRSMRLTLTEPSAATRIAFGDWSLERRAGWRVSRPVQTRASDAKVDALLQSLTRIRATRELATAGEGSGDSTLLFDDVAQAIVGGSCPEAANQTLVLRADGARLCFVTTELNLLNAPANALYERRLFPVRLDDVVAADVGPLQLRRESGVWRIIAPPADVGPARDEAVRAWIEPLLIAQVHGFGGPPVTGLRVRVATRDDDISAMLADLHARRTGETVTLELDVAPSPSTDAARLRAPIDLGTR